MTIDQVLRLGPLIAVVTLEHAEDAEPLARALVRAGLRAVEITLRTPAALEAIRRAARAVPEAVVGAGTVLTPQDLQACREAGAVYAVAPGFTPALLDAAARIPVPLLPGVATPSELMVGLERGYDRFKLFPAEPAGGPALLSALAGPFPQARFCPTGGVNAETAPAYLAQPNVLCVGGTWPAPPALIRARAWDEITETARAALEALRAVES